MKLKCVTLTDDWYIDDAVTIIEHHGRRLSWKKPVFLYFILKFNLIRRVKLLVKEHSRGGGVTIANVAR